MENSIKDFLTSIGCCWRCVLIFQGESAIKKFVTDSNTCANGEDCQFPNGKSETECINDCLKDGISLDSASKRLKLINCPACLGLLQNCYLPETISQISSTIIEGGFDCDSFSLGINVPMCLIIRVHTIWAHLLQKFPEIEFEPFRTYHLGVLKDVFRNLVGARVSSSTKKSFVPGQLEPFNIVINAHYEDDEKECFLLENLDSQKFATRRKQHRKYAQGIFTKQVVEDTLKNISDSRFLEVYPALPKSPDQLVTYPSITCCHKSIYFAGRYTKLSRELPQTPWILDGERRFDSSVQELICEPINQYVRGDGVKFSASGREDVDVRCLGRGRPFVIEFLNPRKVKFSYDEIIAFEKEVNNSTDQINITDLQVVSKKDTNNLKEGEEEKKKSYCALCFSQSDITEVVKRGDGISELELDQITPLRVLHRRPLSLRKRVVHSASIELVDKNFFKVHLTAQAGTYIKEFIHGDFGRTTPNLRAILGVKCDVIALDVEEVKVDWPPPRQSEI